MCTQEYAKKDFMPARKVGIREFREKLATILLESDEPVAITRHGDTVGYYLPARRARSQAEREALKEAASRLQAMLAAQGVSEEEIVRDFRRWRSAKHK
jgi:PHD/YefM family antitoxin component YafN of YafNO toxin-antitoxin module